MNTSGRARTTRIYTSNAAATSRLVARAQQMFDGVPEGMTFNQYLQGRREVIAAKAEAMQRIMAPFDAFDVLDLLRQHELPFQLGGHHESESEGWASLIEIVAAVLLARGRREPEDGGETPGSPNHAVVELQQLAKDMLELAVFGMLADAEADESSPLIKLATEYRAHELSVRNKRHTHLADRFDEALLGERTVEPLIASALGFTYQQFKSVRDAIREIYSERVMLALNELGDVASSWHERGEDADVSETDAQRGSDAAKSVFFFPGQRASQSPADIAARSGVQVDAVEVIVDTFSIAFAERRDCADAVLELLDGRNPLREAALISDGAGGYLGLGATIGSDALIGVAERALKATGNWNRYDKHRARVSESLAAEYLSKLLDVAATYAGLKYFRPKEGVEGSSLHSAATDITAIADETEADALFLVGDVAICVEVKGRAVSEPARRGQVRHLATDLKRTIGDATKQALRLQQLIEVNAGLWLGDRTWLDLGAIREIRSVCVFLDDIGPLSIALDELVRSGIVKEETFPWLVSLHDLAVISEVLDRPAEFLLYLRRRTESAVSLLYRAVDELDLFMLFLQGNLYVEPDPDAVFARYPASGAPTRAARRNFTRNAVATRVHTQTDPLDAWIYYQHDESDVAVPKPSLSGHEQIEKIVDFLHDGHKSGWLRIGADLTNLSTSSQKWLSRGIKEVRNNTNRDKQRHSAVHGFAGVWGYPLIFVASVPKNGDVKSEFERLEVYLTAKKHQQGSDRALGILLSDGEIVATIYDNSPWVDDPELDDIGRQIGLRSVGASEPLIRTRNRRKRSNKRKRR
ncbi:hypothetical protein HQO39_14780 [Rhodococcus fascians]|nr:hypothetical protein [Rhodococcus fascians]